VGPSSRVRVAETFRSTFYAPLWVAVHGDHFAAEGLEVEVVTAEFGAGTVGMMRKGEADVALSGLMRSFDLADRGEAPLVHFAAVNDRNGFFLLGRQAQPNFAWSDLVGKTVISFGGAAEIAAVIAPAFADIERRIHVAAVERYLRQSTWARDPVLTRSGFDTLQTILLAGGFIKRAHRFEDLVDVEIARQAAGY